VGSECPYGNPIPVVALVMSTGVPNARDINGEGRENTSPYPV